MSEGDCNKRGQACREVVDAVAVCRSLMLDDALTSAFTKLHDWCEHELQLGQSGSTKAERMVVVGKVEVPL
eukprot:2697870-Amphidinium_carterae.1